jgi:hypothetical protein
MEFERLPSTGLAWDCQNRTRRPVGRERLHAGGSPSDVWAGVDVGGGSPPGGRGGGGVPELEDMSMLPLLTS